MRFERLEPMRLVGVCARMSLQQDGTADLWRALMPRRHEIAHRATPDYVSMRIHDPADMPPARMFAPTTEFEKWAAVEVSDFGEIPAGMSAHTIGGGEYAVFLHRGPAAAFAGSMRHIFGVWLPGSGFELDAREQFEIVPEGWRADDPDAHEEIWIPVRRSGS